jgi:hypothetical protein
MTVGIIDLIVTISINDTQHKQDSFCAVCLIFYGYAYSHGVLQPSRQQYKSYKS